MEGRGLIEDEGKKNRLNEERKKLKLIEEDDVVRCEREIDEDKVGGGREIEKKECNRNNGSDEGKGWNEEIFIERMVGEWKIEVRKIGIDINWREKVIENKEGEDDEDKRIESERDVIRKGGGGRKSIGEKKREEEIRELKRKLKSEEMERSVEKKVVLGGFEGEGNKVRRLLDGRDELKNM